eukprot:TRINITY_DN5444_c0_g2_i1.p1 TRINITY_DN5444_c0_g2~~TRINITY_DN5444_c0_g2_i1.p1  ORF type:complete len:353 (-),score=54.93 TRINITY_DN5444_c0_g2_i1:47-1036(-)
MPRQVGSGFLSVAVLLCLNSVEATRLARKGKVQCPFGASNQCHCHCNIAPPLVPIMPPGMTPGMMSMVEPMPAGLMPPALAAAPLPPLPPPPPPPVPPPPPAPELPAAAKALPPVPMMSPLTPDDLPTLGPPPLSTTPGAPEPPLWPWTYHKLLHEAMYPTLAPGEAEYKSKIQAIKAQQEVANQLAAGTGMADAAVAEQLKHQVVTEGTQIGTMRVAQTAMQQQMHAYYPHLVAAPVHPYYQHLVQPYTPPPPAAYPWTAATAPAMSPAFAPGPAPGPAPGAGPAPSPAPGGAALVQTEVKEAKSRRLRAGQSFRRDQEGQSCDCLVR